MKKISLVLLVLGLSLSLAGCSSSTSTNTEEKSVDVPSIEQTTEDTSVRENEKMNQMEEDLEEKGIKINHYDEFLYFERERYGL
ncbi:hypothetical protein [Candidatus Enterococcus ikei]|uniref:hypothetical protein n=1 Tax=Candidatus Enterococcus ikei TaxID=2815326 RepID=UPI001F5E1509|nr:hypothetical protein [Enterococcus sp. DIV0869a]